jgi:hypothetical protein
MYKLLIVDYDRSYSDCDMCEAHSVNEERYGLYPSVYAISTDRYTEAVELIKKAASDWNASYNSDNVETNDDICECIGDTIKCYLDNNNISYLDIGELKVSAFDRKVSYIEGTEMVVV